MENSTVMDATMDETDDVVDWQDSEAAIILKDFDQYMEDIEDRLSISRMVSDSVIKGIICAVEKEAAEKVTKKDLELARLKETLHLYHVVADDNEFESCSRTCNMPKSRKYRLYPSYSQALGEHDCLLESLSDHKISAEKQLKMLKKEIDMIKLSSSISRKGSASELFGLGDILRENVPDKWANADRILDSLRTTLDSVHEQVEEIVLLSKSSLVEWQQEREFQTEIEEMVIKHCFWNLLEEFDQRLWHQHSQCYDVGSVKWDQKIKELSSLRQELDTISKSLLVPESGQLISHGSLEHRKVSGNNVSSKPSLREGNGKHVESIITNPENVDFLQLNHLNPEDLVGYFKAEMTKMKRHHESEVQDLTEELFSVKREYLKEKGSSFLVRKDKEFDLLKKKIPEVVMKLDNILVENKKSPVLSDNTVTFDSLKGRLESLHSENCRQRDLLTDKNKEIKCLSLQVSVSEEKIAEQVVTVENLLRTIATLKSSLEDANIEALIREDISKFLVSEGIGQIKCFTQESETECDNMDYEVMFKEETFNIESGCKLEVEDSDMEAMIMQSLREVILQEAFKEAREKLTDLTLKYAEENETRLSLEMELFEKEKALRLKCSEKEALEQKLLLLTVAIDEKDNNVQEVLDALAKEKEKCELTCREYENLKVETNQLQILMMESNEESHIIKGNLVEASEKIQLHEQEIWELRKKIEIMTKNFEEAVEGKTKLLAVIQEKQSVEETREREQKKKMDSIINIVHGLSKAATEFEYRAEEDIKRNTVRLENLSSQLGSLHVMVERLRKTGLQYKQKLERKCSDLQKAEAEVDLLGDEVDTLLGLLEKIYIGLDHYSPILKHYPGIIEILKLVRRELSGEPVKPV